MINQFKTKTVVQNEQIEIRDNLDPAVLSDIKEKMIGQIADYVREQFPTFDWRWNDHSAMNDKTVTSLFFIKSDLIEICEKDPLKIRELMIILEYILEKESGE
ncbi:hypothetical protein AB3N59_16745 [Leptospira sp. WS92.C1]